MEFQKSFLTNSSQREQNANLKDRFASQFLMKTQPNLSSRVDNRRNSDGLRPGNNSSMSQSYTNTRILGLDCGSSSYVHHPFGQIENKTKISKSNNGSVSQTRISQYFPDVKSVNVENSQVFKGPKRSLESFKEKYDPLLAVKSGMTNEQLSERMSDFTRFIRDSDTQRSFSDAQVMHENLKENVIKRKSGSELSERNKFKKLAVNDKQTAVSRMMHLVGNVENVMIWSKKLRNLEIHVLYNVLATFIRTMNGTQMNEKLVFVRGNEGTILECSFHEIDRPIPKITRGQLVLCFGMVIGVQRFKLFSIDILNDEKTTDIQRIVFLSQRTIDEIIKSK